MEKLRKLFFFLVGLTLAIIPFYPVWSEVAVTLLFIFGIMAKRSNNELQFSVDKMMLPMFMVAFFAATAISLLVSFNKLEGLNNLHTYIPFVALPILMFYYYNDLMIIFYF